MRLSNSVDIDVAVPLGVVVAVVDLGSDDDSWLNGLSRGFNTGARNRCFSISLVDCGRHALLVLVQALSHFMICQEPKVIFFVFGLWVLTLLFLPLLARTRDGQFDLRSIMCAGLLVSIN